MNIQRLKPEEFIGESGEAVGTHVLAMAINEIIEKINAIPLPYVFEEKNAEEIVCLHNKEEDSWRKSI